MIDLERSAALGQLAGNVEVAGIETVARGIDAENTFEGTASQST
jgi:hypothetical protein